MSNVIYKGANSNRLHSPNIWADCPIDAIEGGRVDGHYFFDDFIEFDPPTMTGEATDKYYGIGDTDVTILSLADQDHGIIQVAGNDADNDGSVLVRGYEAGWARFGPTDKVWFEGRISKASIADTALAFFLGFMEQPNIAATTALTANDAEPDVSEDFVGFLCLAADGDVVESIYQEGGDTRVNVGDVNTAIAAATYYKYGMRFDGPAGKLHYYLNGSEVQTLSVTSALAFPDANHLSMVWATAQCLTTAAVLTQMDWWAGATVTGG
jgi:hypothetical protein